MYSELINCILQELNKVCTKEQYAHMDSFITMKIHESKENTQMIKYEESNNERLYKMFFIAKKLQGLSDRTLKAYQSEIKRFMKVVLKNFSDITADDIRYYLAC